MFGVCKLYTPRPWEKIEKGINVGPTFPKLQQYYFGFMPLGKFKFFQSLSQELKFAQTIKPQNQFPLKGCFIFRMETKEARK